MSVEPHLLGEGSPLREWIREAEAAKRDAQAQEEARFEEEQERLEPPTKAKAQERWRRMGLL